MARLDDNAREETYRFYVAKSLQLAPRGESLSVSFDEIIDPKPIDTRSGDEIALDVIKQAGLSIGGKT